MPLHAGFHWKGLLDRHDAERRDFQRLLDVLEAIRQAPLHELQRPDAVVGWIGQIGLCPLIDSERAYGVHFPLVNGSRQGLAQWPEEFAQWLILLSSQKIKSYLEIGTFNGATACLAAAYLERFQPDFRLTTVDIEPYFSFYDQVRERCPVERIVRRTSFDFAGCAFDAVFIDGNHSYEWAWADYDNVGRHARVCGFHDVFTLPYTHEPTGGCPTAWQRVIREEGTLPGVRILEFSGHPQKNTFGIGVRLRTA
jgi:predicted O-methyltransferase YrrM